jgi:hypothetical protein
LAVAGDDDKMRRPLRLTRSFFTPQAQEVFSMQLRPKSFIQVLVLLAALAASPAALAQPRPGVGYDPQARGYTTSRYQLDTLLSPWLSYQADFSARPDLVGAHPDPYFLDFSDPAVAQAIERRWGPGTASLRFKRWAGPGNEVRSLLRDALIWAWSKRPELLGGDVTNRNGEPTQVEITDVQAFNDSALWIAYFQAELPGYSPENRVVICDTSKPGGDGQETDPFWGIPRYYHNTSQQPPVSPQLPANLVCAGN